MKFDIARLAVTASFIATANALSAQDIPTDIPVSSLLTSAQTHLAKGETSEALVYYDVAISKDPTNYLTLFKRATAYLSLGRATQATDDFNKVLKLKPGFEGAHVQLAKIKAKVADWEGARSEYIAAKKTSDSPELEELGAAEQAAFAATAAEKAEQWDDCINNAGTAIYVAPRAVSLRETRSRCRFEKGEVEEGMGDLQHVLHLRPGNTKPHLVISAASFYGLGDMDNGLAQIRKCLHSDPDSKVCKKLHKQEKALSKAFARAQAQLNKGQPTTAGRAIVGTAEDEGLIAKVQSQVDELRKDGYIPPKAQIKLHSTLMEMACEAYSEVRILN